MATTNLHGSDAAVYYTHKITTMPGTQKELDHLLDVMTKFDDFAVGFPDITGLWAQMPNDGEALYEPDLEPNVAAKLDSNASAWESSPLLYSIAENYDGEVDPQTVLNRFSSRLNISPIINGGAGLIVINPNKTDIYYILYITSSGNLGVQTACYKRDPFMSSQVYLPAILFGSAAYSNYGFITLSYRLNESTMAGYSAYGMAPINFEDCLRLINKGTKTDMKWMLDEMHEDYEPPKTKDDDPYNDPDSGEGVFDDGKSDKINNPSLPTLSVSDTGFITLFNPSKAQLKSLANYMWSDAFSLNNFKKMFADPMSAILGLSILPIPVPTEGSRAVSVGNISTNVNMPVVSQQFIAVDCGSVTLSRQRPGTYLDFSPYTKVDLYLPFIGTHPLDIDEVMGRSIQVSYHVDVLSGACTAFVKSGDSVLYQFIGQCAISVPITGNDWTNAINGVLNIAGSIGSMVLSGGATAPMAAGGIASTITNNLKPTVEKSGSVSGAGGLLGVKRPYLIINRPNRNVAENQNQFIGYPTFKNKKMNNLDGYNSIESVHLDGIPATADEIREIETLLKGGVIF